jgi:hypothetical protein
MRETTIFYRSFYEALKDLPAQNKAEIYDAIFELSLNGVDTELTGISKTIMTLIKPQILANLRRFENGKKQKRSKSEAKPKQEISETEAKQKQNGSKSEANNNNNNNNNNNLKKKEEEEKKEISTFENEKIKRESIIEFLDVKKCRQQYDEFHKAKKEQLCMAQKVTMQQLDSLLDKFDSFLLMTTEKKAMTDYITHFPNWLNKKPELISEVKAAKNGIVQFRV